MIYLQLFLSFLQIGAFSFGGGYAAMPLIQNQVVQLHSWLSQSEFTDLITISQMTPGDVYIEDIAHALSLLCRGGGQLSYFYSVGQHSLNCAAEAKARGWSERQQLACLLHDASEGYISDIIRPVKIYLSNYLEIESKIMGTILTHFGLDDLTEEESCRWKQIDDEILELELKTLLHGEENREVPKLLSVPDLAEHTPGEIEVRFLQEAERLGVYGSDR